MSQFRLPSVVVAARRASIILFAHLNPFWPVVGAEREELVKLLVAVGLKANRKEMGNLSYLQSQFGHIERLLERADAARGPAIEAKTLLGVKFTPRAPFSGADQRRLEELLAEIGRTTRVALPVAPKTVGRLDRLMAPFGAELVGASA